MPSTTTKKDSQTLAADTTRTNTTLLNPQESGFDGAVLASASWKDSGMDRNRLLQQALQNLSKDLLPKTKGDVAPDRSDSSRASGSGNESSASRDSLLQIPQHSPPSRLRENPRSDWDVPLDRFGDIANHYFEPQGELLHEQRDRRPITNEFSIPTAISSQASGLNSAGIGGFTVSSKPCALQSHPLTGVKRKSGSDLDTTMGCERGLPPLKRQELDTSDMLAESSSDKPPAQSTRSQSANAMRTRSGTDVTDSRPESVRQAEDVSGGPRRGFTEPRLAPMMLPARKVFPIQIGDKLFKLSGASISSDAPSYFSHFFEEQLRQNEGADNVRTLYVDRDPATFEDIALHLQGYHVEPRDGSHFVKLFADAQFFSLPRLTAQLFSSTIYIRIGESEFQISRDLFNNPGDSPNYFSLGFSIFFSTPTEVFPGLSQKSLLRPPSILPPCIPNRSARTFADLLHILKGYPIEIRNEEHRQELLRDARYFHLKGLEQRLIPHTISYNLARKGSEIVIRLEDIRQSGVSFVADRTSTGTSPTGTGGVSPLSNVSSTPTGPGWVFYQRPFVDANAHNLIVEIGGEDIYLSLHAASSKSKARFGRATFHRTALSRITSLFSVVASKMNLPVTQPLGLMMMERGAGVASLPVSPGNTGMSDERVKVRIGSDADVVVDGQKWFLNGNADGNDEDAMDVESCERERRQQERGEDEPLDAEEWVVKKAQFRLRVQPLQGVMQAGKSTMEVILGAVKIQAFGSERGRNESRGFLA